VDTFLRETRQRGGHHHRGGVAHRDRGGRNRYSHLLEQIGQALRGKHSLLAVAGSIQADYQAIADELVIAHAFERNQFLQTRGGPGGRC